MHIVFATKNRRRMLPDAGAEPLYRFIWNLTKENRCYLYRINSMSDHVHMLVNLNPDISLSDFVREIKAKSSQWIKKSGLYPRFDGWCRGYYAASKSIEHKDKVVEYIKNQQSHHAMVNFDDEIRGLYRSCGLEWHSDDMV